MKAIALLSGGLDSTLAVRLILDQGIEVEALKFTSPFCQCDHGGKCFSAEVAARFNIPLKMLSKGEEYLKIVREPQHGYGAGVNPCIDCRIYMLKKAKEYAESSGAAFIFTGEVLGQRPMSQHMRALQTIEREAGLAGKLLRPLSARHLPETEAEKRGWIDRKRLLDITGRSRRTQLDLAKQYDISVFSCPAGGCLLTDKNFARRMRDLMARKADITLRDIALLKTGRHFRYNESRIIVGRNESENGILLGNKERRDLLFMAPDFSGPITIGREVTSEDAIRLAAVLTASYSDAPAGDVTVLYGYSIDEVSPVVVQKSEKEAFLQYRI